ncbi:MAG: PBP1A family penicillin-binding protein [Pseudomonadota bacterium]
MSKPPTQIPIPAPESQPRPQAGKGKRKPAPKRKRRSWLARLIIWSSVLLVVGLLCAVAGLGGVWMWISQDLPRIERLADYRPPAVTQVLAQDGQLMAEFCRERRYVVPLSDVSKWTVLAFVAAEDGGFFTHPGIDLLGILRAAVVNLKAGRVVQGGSTITQQVAKALLLTPQRTLVRKAKEAILAWRIERYLNKDEILYLYLNQIYLGHGAYGVEAASQIYFGKHASELDIAESALLAGLVQAPSRYSPIRHPRRARTRQVYVLERLLADGRITPTQAEAALKEPLDIRVHPKQTVSAPYYEEAVRQWLEERFGAPTLYEGGLTVQTACDPQLSRQASQAIDQGLAELTKRQGFQGPVAKASPAEVQAALDRPLGKGGLEPGQAVRGLVIQGLKPNALLLSLGSERGRLTLADLQAWRHWVKEPGQMLNPGDVVMVRTVEFDAKAQLWQLALVQEPVAQAGLLAIEAGSGRVRAMIGGRDFSQSQYNRAIQAHRQPGSSFKPFIFAASLDRPAHPYTPASILIDAPVVFDDPSQPGGLWKPKNYDGHFNGPTSVRTSLEQSRNVPTVKLLAELGLDYTIAYARRFGIESELVPNLSLALGSAGLSLLEMTRAYSVFANSGQLIEPVFVERVLDREGGVLYQAKPESREVISPQTAFVMTNLLKGVVAHGTGRGMQIPPHILAGKTGTTNDLRDAWFIGYSAHLVCGVWVGRDDNEPLGHKETGGRAAGPIWKYFMAQALADRQPQDFTVPPGVVFARVNPQSGASYFEAFKEGTQPGEDQPAGPYPTPPSEADSQDFLERQTFAGEGQ